MKYNYDIVDFVNCHTEMLKAREQEKAIEQRKIKAERDLLKKIKDKQKKEKIAFAVKIAMVTFIVFAVGVLCGVCLVPVV